MSSVLEGRQLTKRFSGLVALDQIDFSLEAGEVLGFIGQNGSGKSTLLKIIAGIQEPDGGALHIRGEPVRLSSPSAASLHGIGMVHQEQSLIPNLTVAENIFLTLPSEAKRHGLYRWGKLFDAARRQLAKVEVEIPPETVVGDLSFAQRQMVELVKALAIEEFIDHPVIILFDEPTSVLAPGEIKVLFRQIERLRARSSIIFVSHRLDEVLSICDRVLVMSDGRKVAERASAATEGDELYQLMVGHRHVKTHRVDADPRPREENIRLQIRNLSAAQHFSDVSLDLRKGEIVGLAGVLGSGAEEVCRAIFGAEEIVGGTITLGGNKINPRTPADSIQRGVGYLPADRKSEGMLRGRSLVQNMVLTYGLEYGYGGVLINHGREAREAVSWMRRLKVKMQSPNEPIDRLSGGNQQKVILGKWLLSKSLQVLLLDHPTRGLDPGARDDVFDAMREAAKAGLSVIFVGDTVDEILELADRILVMKDGKITARFDLAAGDNPSQEDVLKAMI